MKAISITLLAGITLLFYSFKNKDIFNLKEIENSVSKINESIYAGKYEVSNVLYREFEYDLRINNSNLLKEILPDTLNWRDKLCFNEPYVEFYYRHPAYSNYPVVNITYQDAIYFCEWLTKKYNENSKRKFKKVLFRLPTEKEWELAARGGSKNSIYAWGDRLFSNNHFMCNYRGIGDEFITRDSTNNKPILNMNLKVNNFSLDYADITAQVSSYYPNSFGLYNVCGNVAEMVAEKGKAKGGSWKSFGGEVRIESVEYFKNSANNIGFRYFMEIIEK